MCQVWPLLQRGFLDVAGSIAEVDSLSFPVGPAIKNSPEAYHLRKYSLQKHSHHIFFHREYGLYDLGLLIHS